MKRDPLGQLDTLLFAAAAAQRAGSWQPNPGCGDLAEWEALCDLQDILREHRYQVGRARRAAQQEAARLWAAPAVANVFNPP